MESASKIYVAGHCGLVGSALWRRFIDRGYTCLVGRTRNELDLRRQADVERFFEDQRPEYVILAAGTVGGILANSTRPAEFLYDNLMIHGNVLHAAYTYGVRKLLYLGSSCIYPRLAPQPITEAALLSGPLEPSNEAYAIAKIAGVKMSGAYRQQYGCSFISAMPCNLFGPNDNFDLESSHVLPALIHKFHRAKINEQKEVVVWGSGSALREFLYVDDLAHACEFLLHNYDEQGHVNVGSGEAVSIANLAELIRGVVYPEASLQFDRSKPDGTPRKLLDSSRLRSMGWRPTMPLEAGIRLTYSAFLAAGKSRETASA